MTKTLCFFCILSLSAIAGCANNHLADTTFEVSKLDRTVGWLHGNCFAIKNAEVASGTKISLILLDTPQKIIKGTVVERAENADECYPLFENRRSVNTDSGHSFYLISSDTDINLGIGVIGNIIDIDMYLFSFCTTPEGISYEMSRGTGANIKEVWSGYYYLGYDSESTCQ